MGITAKGRPSGLATLDSTGKVPGPQAALQATAALDFASIAAAGVGTLNVNVPGAAVGDKVVLGAPASINAGLIWCGHVSAADTVTIRLFNSTAAAVDPASATWKVAVFQ